MLGQEKPQDFELIELLIKEASFVKGDGSINPSTKPSSEFESFKARFQSYIDQIPSYLHSLGKEGFFPHFFLGSFSTFIDTEVAKGLKIKKMYFRFDDPKTLKVAVVRDGGNEQKYKGYGSYEINLSLFVILESGKTDSKSKKFTYDELENILSQLNLPAQAGHVRDAKDRLQVRSIEIAKTTGEISIKVENEKLGKGASATYEFKEIKKGLWNNPESDIAELTNPDVKKVKEPIENILKKVSRVHSEYGNSLTYAQGTREAAHHGFVAGALVNFRYRHNLRVYLEQFAGRGYADIVLVPRSKDRSLNAVPIIIELKAGTGTRTTPGDALEQAKDYAKGFQPNTMRVLTVSDNVLCVGLNLDSTKKFSMHISPPADRKPARPTIQKLLEVTSSWNGERSTTTDITEKIKQPLERIYHTFPGTPEKGGNYFSRFLLGQLLLANEFERIHLEKSVFLYNEYPLASSTRSGAQSTERPVTTFMLTKGNHGQNKEVFIFHIREGGKGEFSEKKIPINLPAVGKITEVCISLQEERKSDCFNVEKVNRYNSLNEYKQGKSFFGGEWKNIPYPAELKEKFDAVLESQLVSSQDRSQSIGKYKELFGKLGEAVLPFKVLIEREAHTQAVFHGAFSHYSDMKLGELQENRALVLTEFQTGRGKRIDMVVHGIKFADQASSAKEYDPVGLELKGPREGKTADALVKEANDQINTEYVKGVTYKTLTDGTEVAFMGVVFDKGASNADSLILMSKDEFASVKVIHSSIFSFSQQQPGKRFDPNSCVGQSSRSKRSNNDCLFSKGDVEEFSKGKVDENNVDKVIIDSEKFLTYVKSSQDKGKNAQLVEFIGNKNIEGDYKYLVDKVIGDQGYERYIQNERIKDLQVDVLQQNSGLTKNPKLKSRLMNAAGGIQLIRGIHGAIVSCKDGTATDCGLNLGGIAWSFASQPIENVMVKMTPKVVASAEKVVGKIIPGVLGKQTKFAVRVVGVKFGSTIARGTAGAIVGVFDIVEIGMSASNLVDCKKREKGNNPCGEKEIRDNIASISFSGVSFVSGVALTAASMPVVGIAVGFGLMVGYGIYSGVSNIVEYEKKYNTTHEENWSIFWRTILFQPMADDVQHLAARKDTVNSLAKQVWKALNNGPNSTVAYGIGLGKISNNALHPSNAKIIMDKKHADTRSISRVIPDSIKNAKMICLPRITNADYEKGLKKSVPAAVHYCDNAMVIADGRKSMQNGKTIVYDLRNVNSGNIIGSNVLDNSFLIFGGSEKIIGGDNTVNRFVLTNSGFAGQIIVGTNSTNVFDLSQIADSIVKVNIGHSIGSTTSKTLHSGVLEIKMNDRSLINECVTNDVNILGYHYIGRQNKTDEVSCTSSTGDFIDYDTIIDSKGGYNNDKRDIIENCDRAIILPYTDVRGTEGNYVFYIKAAGYKGKDLHSEINVKGTGTVIFPETDLLNDCDEITYSSNNNTLSLKIGLGQNNRYTLDIKNYIKQSTSKPNFILIDKNGSNIVPKIKELGATKINSFELHSEYALDNFDDVENHYKKILNNNKDYKVFSVIRGKTQSQDNNAVPHMVFGSLKDDIVNFDQGTTFARGGEGNDVYFISGDINSREVKIDNNSDDRKLDAISMPEVSEEFRVQECDLYLDYNNTNIQVKNYLKDNRYRHLTVMNSKGETFIPYVQSMSCVSFSIENGKLVPFFHATQTQNMFVLPKDFQDDHVVIDSRLEDIERYRNKDHLLLIRNNEVPFIIKVEDFYDNQSKWRDVNFLLWNDGNFSPYLGLRQEVNGIMYYQDKLKSDYEKTVKEYTIDFNESVDITRNQNGTLNSVEEDEKHIGVMILKDITPDRIKVSSSNTDLVFSDEVSNHTVNIKNWNNSESYRISMLEFDLGLEPIIIRKLDGFSLSEVKKIQDLIEKASDNYQKRTKYAPDIEDDFKCLVSVNGFKSENKTYECLGFSSLQDQINFTENFCSAEQIEEFKGKIPNNDQVLLLLKKLQNDLSLNGYDQNLIDQCDRLMITSGLGILKLLINNAAQKGEWERVKDLLDTTANRSNADIENKKGWSSTWTLLHYAVYNGNLDLLKDTYQLLLSKVIDVNAKDKYGWTPLYYAIYYNEPKMVEFFIDKGANIDIKNNNGKTPLEVANGYGKPKIISILINKVIENGQFDVVKNFLKKTAKKTSMKDENEWRTRWKLLHYAAYNGKLNIVKDLFSLLLEKSGGVNVKEGYHNYTPLHCAVYYNRHEMVKFLIEQGANIEARTVYSDTPLHIAARYCGLDMVKLLVEKGCNTSAINNHKQMPSEITGDRKVKQFLNENNGLSPLHYAAKEGNLDLLKVLLNKGDNINAKDKYGWTPLHYAVEHNRFDVMKLLINSNAISIEAKDRNGKTPLHVAARQGCITSINLLLGKGANVTAKTNNSDWNWTPLHYAVYYNKPDAVKYLMGRGANVKVRDKKGNTPAYYAVGGHRAYDRKKRSTSDSSQQSYAAQSQEDREDRLEVLELLISEADVETKNDDDQTLFHIAAQGRRLRAVRLLVNKIESVNFEDSLYEEPNELIRAVRQRERLKSLINEKDKFGYTPLQYAAKNGNWGMVNLFLDKTAEGNPDDVANKDQFSISWTTVHYTVYNGDLNLLNDIFQFLSDKETIINTKDNSGWTPLHYAVYYNASDMVKFLVNEGADISVKDKDDKRPLDIAINRKYDSVVKYLKQAQLNEQLLAAAQDNDFSKVKDLINLDADVNIKDKDGKTPLHYASQSFHHLDIVKYLISRDADIDAKDNNDRTPLDVADSSIIKILRQAHLDKELLITVQSSDLERIKSLIAQGVSKDRHGAYYYAWRGDLGTVKFIVENEGGVNITDKYGCTLLHWAALKGHSDIAKFLVDRGANVNAKDILGRTPMHFTVMNNHVNITEFLLKQGVRVDETDKNGSTPLHYAAEFSQLDSARFLIGKGANINTADNSGKKAIHIASENNNKNIIELFLSKGVSVDNADKDGWTSLHYAARRGCLGATEFLIEKGADTKAKDKNGQVPLCVAAQYNKSDIIDFLLNRGATIEASDFNDGPILKLAYCIKGVMEKINDKEQISHFEELKSKLPESVKNAVFSSKVCIKNLYQNEYLYAASSDFNYDDKRRRVFTWIPGDKKDGELKWKIEPYGDSYSIMNVEFNEYLYAVLDDLNYDKDRRRVFTWVPGGKDEQSLWRVEPCGDDIHIMNVKSKEYLYAADYAKYDDNRRRVFTWVPEEYIRQGTWKIENCGSIHKKRDIQELDGKAGSSLEAIRVRARNKSSDSQLLALPGRLGDHLLDGSNQTGVGEFVSQVANTKGNKEKPLQRRCRHHHGDHNRHCSHLSRNLLAIDSSNQPEIAASSGTRPSSWINDLFGWVKSSIGGLLNSKPTLSKETSSTSSPISQVDAKIDVNGTIILLDVLVRKVTGQKYISTVDQSISPLEAQGYALNITNRFEKVVEQKSGVSMHRLNIDFVGMQKEITRKVIRGQFNEISGILSSYVEKAFPGKEAGCPGKLSEKRFNEFMAKFNKGLDVTLNQSIEHNVDDTLEVNNIEEQQGPRSYLNNTSIQGHLTRNKVKLIS